MPDQLVSMHNVFHVYMFRKFWCDEERVCRVDFCGFELQPDISMEIHPDSVLDYQDKEKRSKQIRFVKVQWSNND